MAFRLEIPSYHAEGEAVVVFMDVAVACAKRVMAAIARERGEDIELVRLNCLIM